jgi:hypothetical protein
MYPKAFGTFVSTTLAGLRGLLFRASAQSATLYIRGTRQLLDSVGRDLVAPLPVRDTAHTKPVATSDRNERPRPNNGRRMRSHHRVGALTRVTPAPGAFAVVGVTMCAHGLAG